nr:PilZ domain-containing protein [uncultured Desulfobulbus sp.]
MQRAERDNRRRSIRRLLSTPFRFSEISDLEKSSTYLEEKAKTVDLSSHGLCFSCDRLLQPDTMIYYAVEGENKRDLAHGLGRVIWSKQVENQPLFHIGVDFSSHSPQLDHH